MFRPVTSYVLVTVCVVCYTCAMYCPHSCSCSKTSVTCTSGLPSWLPNGTTSVDLNNIGVDRLSASIFKDSPWGNVKELIIKESANAIEPHLTLIDNFAFSSLENLHKLRLHRYYLTYIYDYNFYGLDKLQILDLSDSAQGGYNNLWKVLREVLKQRNTLNHLRVLNLANVSPTFGILILDNETLQAFNTRPLRELNLSKAPIGVIDRKSFQKNLQQLEILNLSSTTLIYLLELEGLQPFPRLKALDLRNSQLFLPSLVTSGKKLIVPGFDVIQTVQELYLGGILSLFEYSLYDTTLEFIPYNVSIALEKLDISNSGFLWLNITNIYGTDFCTSLDYLNISRNNLEYVIPVLCKTCSLLRVLDISRNDLHVMSEYYKFSLLFENLKNIRIIYFSHNGLKSIPFNMFASNINLRILDLSYNLLEYVHFNISHLHSLSTLNLRFNVIKCIDGGTKYILDSLRKTQSQNGQTGYELEIGENPFLCTCELIHSVTYLVRNVTAVFKNTDMMCNLEGHSRLLDEHALSKTQYLCDKPLIIATSVTSSVIFLVCAGACLFVYTRWRRRKSDANRMRRLVQRFREDEPNDLFRTEDFLVFLCYCSEDENFVDTNVRHQLLHTLQEMLKTQRDGDTHFVWA